MKSPLKPIKTIGKSTENIGEYTKYRWFYTSSKKFVIGGKNAEQNEEIVRDMMKSSENYIVMHTREPGSPFSVIKSWDFNEKDLEECAIFTACFSRAWRECKKSVIVDIFMSEQIIKKRGMKTGTFGVSGNIKHEQVELKLYLIKQGGVLRAVPFKPKSKEFICIIPGNISKDNFAEQIAIKLEIVKEEVLQALPTGGFRICN